MGGNLLPRTESRKMGERLVPYVTGRPKATLPPSADGLHPLRKTCLPLKTASAGAGML